MFGSGVPAASAPLGLRRGVERPKPLRLGATLPAETTAAAKMDELETLVARLTLDPGAASRVNAALKAWGKDLEEHHPDRLDQIQAQIHAACRESRLDQVSKLHLLEVIELRAMHWVPNDKVAGYYRQKLAESVSAQPCSTFPTPAVSGDSRTKDDGSLDKPSWMSGSNNRETFPQVPNKCDHKFEVAVGDEKIFVYGSNANLVRIAKIVLDEHFGEHKLHSKPHGNDLPSTGHSSAPIIFNPVQERRASSSSKPIRNPLFPGALPEEILRVEGNATTGADLAAKERRVNFAKTQQESLIRRPDKNNNSDANNQVSRDVHRYDRDFLLKCANFPESLKTPQNWDQIVAEFPALSRKVCEGEDQPELSKASSLRSPSHRQDIKPWKAMCEDASNTRA